MVYAFRCGRVREVYHSQTDENPTHTGRIPGRVWHNHNVVYIFLKTVWDQSVVVSNFDMIRNVGIPASQQTQAW